MSDTPEIEYNEARGELFQLAVYGHHTYWPTGAGYPTMYINRVHAAIERLVKAAIASSEADDAAAYKLMQETDMAKSNHNGTWTLSQAEYQELKNDAEFLRCLEAAGVDNWEGYSVARRMSEEDES